MSINRSLHRIAKEGVVQTLEAKDKEIERLNKRILTLEEQLKEAKNCLGIISPSRELKEGKYWENEEIERLNNIIKEVREYIEAEKVIKEENTLEQITNYERKLLEILDKENI